jgi:plastocyanin
VPYVADVLDDAGLGNAVALDKDGTPFVSYLIFPAELAEGEIALPRPIGAPFIETLTAGGAEAKPGGAVGIASVASNGIWTRGAAAQVIDSPAGIVIPYGPATVDTMIGATAQNTNGSDIAIDANGGKHVVWAQPDGVWYSVATPTGGFTATQLYKQDPPLTEAGPIGRPSVAVDRAGDAWVAFTVDTAAGQSVEVFANNMGKWSKPTSVATVPLAPGGPQPRPTEIAMADGAPVVVYIDGSAGAVMAARQQADGTWSSETIASGIAPSGPSLAVGSGGSLAVSYYTGTEVDVATSTAAGVWTPSKVADANPGSGIGNFAETTGVAIDDAGAVYVTWRDDTTKSVVLATGGGTTGAFNVVDTRGTQGGAYPSLGVTPDGSRVYLAWYATVSQDLLVGIMGEVGDLQVAAPSPTASYSPPPPASACPTGGVKLEAPSGAALNGFAQTTLTAPANKAFTICFDNQDTGVPHNVDLFDKQGGTSLAKASIITGVAQANVDVSALKPGTYFYQCDVHPTTMTGTLTVK